MWHFQQDLPVGHRHTCILASNTVRGLVLEAKPRGLADWAAQETRQLAGQLWKGRDIVSAYIYSFPLFPSLSFPPFLFIATISLSVSSSLAFRLLSLSHPHSNTPHKAPVLSPTFNFSSHSLTSLYLPPNLLLSAWFYFLSLTFPFLHSFFFLSPIYTISLTHTSFSFSLSLSLSLPFNFLSLPPPHLYPSHSLLISISVLLSPSPLLISFLTCSPSLSLQLLSTLSPTVTLSFCHTRYSLPSFLSLFMLFLSSIAHCFPL